MYYNWLPLVEYEDDENTKVRKYAWGLDLAGRDQSPDREGGVSIDSAGGIGGLISMRDADGGTNYVCFYDATLDTRQGLTPRAGFASNAAGRRAARQGRASNLGQLVDRSDGFVDAKYEYDAYGNNLLDA